MTSPDDLAAILGAVRSDLAMIAQQDFGYPLGTNELRPPAAHVPNTMPAALHALYRACDGLSLPDVHIGYFLDTAERAATAAQRGEPTQVAGAPVHVFGSDGGGGRFALGLQDAAVYCLPSSGAVRGGHFIDDADAPAHKLAANVRELLERLAADVHAFAIDDGAHRYVVP
jgi:hypothetical protein